MELFRALGALLENPGPAHDRLGELLELGPLPAPELHLRLFTLELYPYASVFLGAEGKMGGEARDRIAGFWRAIGVPPPPEPDHLAALLAAYASLCDNEAAAVGEEATRIRHVRRAFLFEHLASWLPAWLAQLDRLADPFYRGWGRVLREAVEVEAAALDAPASLPLHLRAVEGLADPRASGGELFLTSLLAPARSGVLLARSDLARAASELGLGLRAGERAYVLKALVSQDAAAALAWLAAEAQPWSDRHRRSWAAVSPAIGAHWAERAASTASRLRELAVEAGSP